MRRGLGALSPAGGWEIAAAVAEYPPLAGRLNLAPVKQLRGGAGPDTAGCRIPFLGRPCSSRVLDAPPIPPPASLSSVYVWTFVPLGIRYGLPGRVRTRLLAWLARRRGPDNRLIGVAHLSLCYNGSWPCQIDLRHLHCRRGVVLLARHARRRAPHAVCYNHLGRCAESRPERPRAALGFP